MIAIIENSKKKKTFFVPFLFLILAILTMSCSKTTIEEEVGIDETDQRPKTYLIDKGEVEPPIDRD
jgi:hypothetical protein